MALDVTVELVGSGYAAARHDDERAPEWPPHPARLFCALVDAAGAGDPLHDTALRWLEVQGPPEILASRRTDVLDGALLEGFVPTNQLSKATGSTLYPGRTNAPTMRPWARCHPKNPLVMFRWSGEAPTAVRASLADLCRRVGYLGRSTSPAILSVGASAEAPEALAVWRPQAGGDADLSVPYPGYLDDLRDAYESDESSWEVPRHWVGYGTRSEEAAPATPSTGPYRDFVVLRMGGRHRVNAAHAIHFTSQLRRAVQSQVDGGPPRLHGHDVRETNWQQVSFLALPFVGHDHADGHIVGLGAALPAELAPAERREVLRGILAVEELHVPRFGTFPLGDVGEDTRVALQQEHWVGPSRVWASAVPVVLDRFPKRPGDTDALVARACRHAQLPEPARVETSRFPIVPGAPMLRSNQRRRRPQDPARPAMHARIVFSEPVRGPVVLGNLRHLGLGLCVPQNSGADT